MVQDGGGVLALWSGFLPRAFRTVGATFILTLTRDYFIDVLEKPEPRLAAV